MAIDHTEKAFETAIEDSLLTNGGYSKADPKNFDRSRCLDPTVLIPSPRAVVQTNAVGNMNVYRNQFTAARILKD